ncbi:LytR/AlgR family response regulator transcription factor [Neolewinella persica]|uniref:LytR/AlgR family response regulator transcription factor n=1 Tax=Neolewinella persica TaxID=70998 RepID=UPI00036B896F|nr:response regulator [Neolewinella persica]
MTDLSCVIVDDERLARVELTSLLTEIGGCRIIGESGTARAAIPLIDSLRPDLLFLDINMPGTNGFELLSQLNYCPLVVFVTAYDQYAIKAFEVHALDYLMKPVRSQRLAATLTLVRERLSVRATPLHQLFLPDKDGGGKFLSLENVHLIRTYDHYLRLYHSAGSDMIHQSLSAFAKKLDTTFFQINRSEIVRLEAVQNIGKLSRGRYALTLPGGEVVTVSESRGRVWRKMFD